MHAYICAHLYDMCCRPLSVENPHNVNCGKGLGRVTVSEFSRPILGIAWARALRSSENELKGGTCY